MQWLSLDWSTACTIKIIFFLDDKIKKIYSISGDVLIRNLHRVETDDCLNPGTKIYNNGFDKM